MKLKKVIYTGRHGERAPLKVPPKYEKDWKMAGVLTSKGAESQYKKGQYLHNKYQDFLTSIKDRIFCQSSNMDRTIDSAFCLINGLLNNPFASPSTVTKKEKLTLLFKYGASIKPLSCDVLYKGYYADMCPSVEAIYEQLNKNAFEKKDHFEELFPVLPAVGKITEVNKALPMDYFAVLYFYDFLESYRANGMPFPKGFEDGKMYKQIAFIHYYFLYDLMFKSEIIRRLANYYIYKEIMQILTDSSDPSFHYYSSHDGNILSLILGLGFNIKEVPIHSSGFTIEMYESTEGKFINLEYKEQNLNKAVFPEVSTPYVPLEKLLERLNKEMFNDDEEFKAYSGNKEFDYVKDYVNAKPIDLEDPQLNEQKQMDSLFKKT